MNFKFEPLGLFALFVLFEVDEGLAAPTDKHKTSLTKSSVKTFREPTFYHRQEIITPDGREVIRRTNTDYSDVSDSRLRSGYPVEPEMHYEEYSYDCEYPFRNVGSSCYYATCPSGAATQSWTSARSFCQNTFPGSDLAVFEDANAFRDSLLYIQATDLSTTCSYWIGATDPDKDQVYTWITNFTVPSGVPFWGTGNPTLGNTKLYALLDRTDYYWIHNENINGGSKKPVVPLCEIPSTVTHATKYGTTEAPDTGTGSGDGSGDGSDSSNVNVNVEGSSFSSSNNHTFISDPVVNSQTTHETSESEPINIKIHYPKIIYIQTKPDPHYPPPQPHYPAPQPQPHYPAPQPHYPAPQPQYPPKPHYQPEPHYTPKPHAPYQAPYISRPQPHKPAPYSPQFPHHMHGVKQGYSHPHSHHHHHKARVPGKPQKGYSDPGLRRIVSNLSGIVGKKDAENSQGKVNTKNEVGANEE